MSHIVIRACNTNRIIQEILIDCKVVVQNQFDDTPLIDSKINDLNEKLKNVVLEYFDFLEECDVLSENEFYQTVKERS